MQRGFSLWATVFSGPPCGPIVDSVEHTDGTLSVFRFSTGPRKPGRTICTAPNALNPHSVRFLPKFPLFRGAYCYYWFYMFFIWYKPNRLEMMVLNSHAMRSALQRGIP